MPLSGGFLTAEVYLAAISAFAAIITVYDKLAAKSRRRRVPEATLLFTAAVGGSAAMLLVMLLIRHKTRHVKFMAGIPVILLFQIFAVLLAAGTIKI
jgi:uncharacterized membrane protein YsdA (DUF1294 family)